MGGRDQAVGIGSSIEEKLRSTMRFFRKATPGDAPDIDRLYRELRPYASVSVLPERIEHISNDQHTYLIVCEEHTDILATALVSLCADVMFGHQPFAVIDNMVVSKDYLREGIGKSMIDHIEAFCIEQQCSKIIINLPAELTQARDFFTAMGFDPDETLGFIKHRKYFGA
jgi:N-acetylglutamate synthase-like GNAT family acetyltransferase